MSEEMKNGVCSCNPHGCGMCSGEHGFKKHMMVKIFMIVIIIMSFSLGMQIGELKGQLRGSYGMHSKMMRWDNDGDYKYGMMGNFSKDQKVEVPATPVKK